MSSALAQYSNVLDDDGHILPISFEVTRYMTANGSLSQVTTYDYYNITQQNPLGTLFSKEILSLFSPAQDRLSAGVRSDRSL